MFNFLGMLQALTTFALTEAQANVMTPARRLFREAEQLAVRSGLLAMQYVFWSWGDCELQQGNPAMAVEVLKRGLRVCKTPALMLLLAKACPCPLRIANPEGYVLCQSVLPGQPLRIRSGSTRARIQFI